MQGEVLARPEVGHLLKVAEMTLYWRAHQGLLPACEVGYQWGCDRVDLEQWVDPQNAGHEGGEKRE